VDSGHALGSEGSHHGDTLSGVTAIRSAHHGYR
jgi:hypothetical protein